MSELSKYEIFILELSSVEVQVSTLREQYEELQSRSKELEERLSSLQRENEYLKLQLENGENSTEQNRENVFGSLSVKEREDLKLKISDVITKINNHLTSA